jgi:hypothetical protein
MIKIENQSPFVRVVREITFHHDGQSIESYRESRPWVICALGTAMIGFCIWLYTVVEIGDIFLGR